MDCGTCVVGGPASVFLSGTDGYADFAGEVVVGVASPAVLRSGTVPIGGGQCCGTPRSHTKVGYGDHRLAQALLGRCLPVITV